MRTCHPVTLIKRNLMMMPLDFIRVSSLRRISTHYIEPSLADDELPGLRLPDHNNLILNFCPGWV